MLTNEKTN